MKIVHVPHAYAPVFGGAELHCRRLSEELVRLGHEVHVLTADVNGVDAYHEFTGAQIAPPMETINNVTVCRLPYCTSGYYSFGRFFNAFPETISGPPTNFIRRQLARRFSRLLERKLKEIRPDVVMTLPHSLPNVRCVTGIAWSNTFPFVMTPMLHSGWNEKTRNWLRSAFQRADAVIANTSAEAEVLKDEYRVPAGRVFVGWLGVDVSDSRPVTPRKSQVFFLGRIVSEKGVLELVGSMRHVWQSVPEATLIIAGARAAGTAAIESVLQILKHSERAKIEIRFFPSESEKMSLLHESACLVLPSKNESFGLVLLEAMACSTPVITYDLPVFRSFLTHAQDSLLVPPDDPRALGTAIAEILLNQSVASALGARGRQLVLERFTWRAVAERYLEAYSRAISSRQSRSHSQS